MPGASLQTRIKSAFGWLGGGAGMLVVTLFGTVSADAPTKNSPGLTAALLILGSVGTIFIIIGLVVMFSSLRDLREGGANER